MPPPPSAAPAFRPTTRRFGGWISGVSLLCSVLLAGCTNSIELPSLTAHLDDRQYDNWLFQSHYREGHDLVKDLLVEPPSLSAQTPNLSLHPKVHLAHTALNFLGVRYRWGGNDPKTGFDCSGLVTYAAHQSLGLKLPRRAVDLASQGKSVKRHELDVGDLVFFNTLGRRFSHVGIYIGDDQFVHAPRAGSVVRVENLRTRYWTQRYTGARRLNFTQLSAASPGK